MKKLLLLALVLGGCSGQSLKDAKGADAQLKSLCVELAHERAANQRLDGICAAVEQVSVSDGGAGGR